MPHLHHGLLWLLTPFILCGTVLNVGDGLGRFDIVPAHGEIRDRVEVRRDPRRDVYLAVWRVERDSVPPRSSKRWSWPDLEYRVTVRLMNSHDLYPPPLFWKPYEPPVEAMTTVRIGGP